MIYWLSLLNKQKRLVQQFGALGDSGDTSNGYPFQSTPLKGQPINDNYGGWIGRNTMILTHDFQDTHDCPEVVWCKPGPVLGLLSRVWHNIDHTKTCGCFLASKSRGCFPHQCLKRAEYAQVFAWPPTSCRCFPKKRRTVPTNRRLRSKERSISGCFLNGTEPEQCRFARGKSFFSLKGPAEIVKGLLNCRYQMVNFVLREIVDLSPGTHSDCFLKRITCFFFRQPHISELVQRDLEVNNRRVLGYFASSSLPERMGQALAD